MMEKMTRRTFLKCAGSAALAMAAAGALTACGPEDVPTPAPAPAPSVKPSLEKPTKNDTGIDVVSIDGYGVGGSSTNGVETLYAKFPFTVKNTSNAPITLTKDTFTVKLNDGEEQKLIGIYDQTENGAKSFTTKELKAGESAPIEVRININKSNYNSILSGNPKVELIVHNNGATASFKFQPRG